MKISKQELLKSEYSPSEGPIGGSLTNDDYYFTREWTSNRRKMAIIFRKQTPALNGDENIPYIPHRIYLDLTQLHHLSELDNIGTEPFSHMSTIQELENWLESQTRVAA